MDEKISDRLLDQRLRNRVIEEIHSLTEGVSGWGAADYFNNFFFQMNGNEPWPNCAMTEAEHLALADLCQLMNLAADATPKHVTTQELIASGWPERIKPKATKALDIFLRRGRFGEDTEEIEPSAEDGKVWYRHVSGTRI